MELGGFPHYSNLQKDVVTFLREVIPESQQKSLLQAKSYTELKDLISQVQQDSLTPPQQQKLAEIQGKFTHLGTASEELQALPVRQLVRKVFKAAITKEGMAQSLKKIGAIAKHTLASVLHSDTTSAGKTHRVKQAKAVFHFAENFIERCFAQNVRFSGNLLVKSHNIAHDEAIQTKEDFTKAVELVNQIRAMQPTEFTLLSTGIRYNTTPDYAIADGICLGIAIHLLQKVQEYGVEHLDGNALAEIVSNEQGDKTSQTANRGWSAEASANQAVSQLIATHGQLNLNLYIPSGMMTGYAQDAGTIFCIAMEHIKSVGVPAGYGRAPFDCDLELVKPLVLQFLRTIPAITVGQFMQKMENSLEFPLGLADKKESLKEFLKSVDELRFFYEKKFDSPFDSKSFAFRFEEYVRQLFDPNPHEMQHVTNPILRGLYRESYDKLQQEAAEEIVARARGYTLSKCHGFPDAWLVGNDAEYLYGIKDRLDPGTYTFSFDTAMGGHATSLIVTKDTEHNKHFFLHDPNIGLIECDLDAPERSLLHALHLYEEPKEARQYKTPGKMFHNLAIRSFTSYQQT